MINIIRLVKKFGDRVVLKSLDLDIADGEILFVIGTSGTGKSVLLKNIVGLLRPDDGEIWLDGERISDFSEEQYQSVRKKCGMVFQHPALFDSLTCFENVAFGLRRHYHLEDSEIRLRVKEALAWVQLNEIENKYPNEISYGMQKRVSLARTIALRPQTLMFDEPTTGLDPISANAINLLIQKLSRNLNTTSVVVSHDMGCALAIADRIVVMDQGQIIAQGSPAELKKSQEPLVKDFLMEVLS